MLLMISPAGARVVLHCEVVGERALGLCTRVRSVCRRLPQSAVFDSADADLATFERMIHGAATRVFQLNSHCCYQPMVALMKAEPFFAMAASTWDPGCPYAHFLP